LNRKAIAKKKQEIIDSESSSGSNNSSNIDSESESELSASNSASLSDVYRPEPCKKRVQSKKNSPKSRDKKSKKKKKSPNGIEQDNNDTIEQIDIQVPGTTDNN